MLRMNLSTRPFYNERVCHLVLAILGGVSLWILTLGVIHIVELVRSNTQLTEIAEERERVTSEMSMQIAALLQETNDPELNKLTGATREANRLIDQRTFSWTEFFNRIERTLPEDVMLTSIRPDIDIDAIRVVVSVIGREVDDIDQFIKGLEVTGAFEEILAREEETTDDGMYRVQLVGRYVPGEVVPSLKEESLTP